MRYTVPVGVVLLAVACGESPASPRAGVPPGLLMTCAPSGVSVSCSATLYAASSAKGVDVRWTATWHTEPAGLVTSPAYGTFTPIVPGELTVSASYGYWNTWPQRFRVDPAAPSRKLRDLRVAVSNVLTGAALTGAAVSITSGYKAGQSCVTAGSLGSCSIVGMLPEEAFQLTVTAIGYVAFSTSHTVAQTGDSDRLTVRLTPAGAPGP